MIQNMKKIKRGKRGIHYVLEDIEKRPETQKDHEHHFAAICHFVLDVCSGGGEQHYSRDGRY